MKRILVIAAHPDDEALGVAGTLVRHAVSGDMINILFLADGEGSRGTKNNLSKRQNAAHLAGKIMGASSVKLHNFPDNKMDSVPQLDVIKVIEEVILELQPNIIYTHHGGDLNIDHQVTHRALMTALRPMPSSTIENIYGFEVLSSTEWGSLGQDAPFRPSHYVDITETFDRKLSALKCYDDEMRLFPNARSYEAVAALASLRGSQVGLMKAEAFSCLRSIWR